MGPGAHHLLGESAHFAVRHSGKEHGHQEGGHLVIGDFAAGIAVYQELNFLGGKLFAIPLPVDQVDSAHF